MFVIVNIKWVMFVWMVEILVLCFDIGVLVYVFDDFSYVVIFIKKMLI